MFTVAKLIEKLSALEPGKGVVIKTWDIEQPNGTYAPDEAAVDTIEEEGVLVLINISPSDLID